ncbi:P-loop NTPase [Desulfobacterales bacterium HSG17]|nr:P-loop NTPase [Desulfobacterales bacterium HSG17]
MKTKKTTIIPIASGKGGVGKSIFAANLSIALARLGHSTIAVDLDLGSSNLYTCLGMPNTYPGIGDFLKSKTVGFNDLPVQTSIPNLKFLPGDGQTPFMANLSQNQRMSLLKSLKNLPARYVILDLGAGTMFSILNFFGLTYKSMIVTTFDTMSIMNCVMFLRNFIFRILCKAVYEDQEVLNILLRRFQQPTGYEPVSIRSLLQDVRTKNPQLAQKAEEKCKKYRPRIVFNMGQHSKDLDMLPRFDAALNQGLSIEPEYFGFMPFDEHVRNSSRNREVFMLSHPDSIASSAIERLANQVINNWDSSTENSMSILKAETEKLYRNGKRG